MSLSVQTRESRDDSRYATSQNTLMAPFGEVSFWNNFGQIVPGIHRSFALAWLPAKVC